MKVVITADDFKLKFRKDFVYGDEDMQVSDTDIANAISEADMAINYDLYPDPTENDIQKTALLYLTAHFLFLNIDTAETGGQAQFNIASKSVNGISVGFDIPEWCKTGEAAIYATTAYGLRFLMLSKPYLDGSVFTITGMTQY